MMTLNEEIYKTVMKIPYGKVATYGQIATICGNPYYARAVGNALHKNPNPQKIPCYRVVNSKGKLTENFAFGGLKVQSDLLISEGIEVIFLAVVLAFLTLRVLLFFLNLLLVEY